MLFQKSIQLEWIYLIGVQKSYWKYWKQQAVVGYDFRNGFIWLNLKSLKTRIRDPIRDINEKLE